MLIEYVHDGSETKLHNFKSKTIHSSRPKEVSQSEIKILINFVWLRLLVRPSIHFYTKMSIIFNVNFQCQFTI